MSLLDSNIIIDSSRTGEESLRELIASAPLFVSVISSIEVLGYHRLTEQDCEDLEAFFSKIEILSLSNEVAERAVMLRQVRKMGLGDALIAGTALVHQLPLVTRNTRDFAWIDGLTLIDPPKNV